MIEGVFGNVVMNKEVLQFKSMQYIISYPKGYTEDKKYPVILFLHGAGSRGNNIDLLSDNPYFKITDNNPEFPFITIAPLCSANTWFDMFETLKEFVQKIRTEEYVELKKIYIIGASMGGYATWQLGMSLPECFTAIVPICGGGMYWNAGRLINVPVWAFHGNKDNTVFVEESMKMVDAVNRNGGNARLTIYPENGHDAWSDTYRNSEVFKWLLSCEKHNSKEVIDIYKDGDIYG